MCPRAHTIRGSSPPSKHASIDVRASGFGIEICEHCVSPPASGLASPWPPRAARFARRSKAIQEQELRVLLRAGGPKGVACQSHRSYRWSFKRLTPQPRRRACATLSVFRGGARAGEWRSSVCEVRPTTVSGHRPCAPRLYTSPPGRCSNGAGAGAELGQPRAVCGMVEQLQRGGAGTQRVRASKSQHNISTDRLVVMGGLAGEEERASVGVLEGIGPI